jgi:ABC-type branched-subunit amino acid transport system substrate-binding protein
MIFPNTGLDADVFAAARSGVQARLDAANAAGGIHGRKIITDWRDDESKPEGNLAAARGLVGQSGVFGIVESSSVATGSADWLAARGIPVVGQAIEPVWSRYRNMFSYATRVTNGPSTTTWGDFVRRQGGSKAVIVAILLAESSRNISDQLGASLAATGIKIADPIIDVQPNVANYEQIGRRIAESGADTIIGAVNANDFVEVLKAARAAGAKIDVAISPIGYDPAILQKYGKAAAGTYFYTNYVPFEANTAAHEAFLTAMTTFSPEQQPAETEQALMSYIDADLFLRGLQEAGKCPTRTGFIKALRAVKDYDAGGLLPGKIDMEESFGKLSLCYTFIRVNAAGTAFEIVPDAFPQCGTRLTERGPSLSAQALALNHLISD